MRTWPNKSVGSGRIIGRAGEGMACIKARITQG